MLRLTVQRRIPCRFSKKPLLIRNVSSQRLSARRNWKLPVGGAVFIGLTSLYFFVPDPSRSAPTSANRPLSADHFTPATVISNEISGPNSKILNLRVPPHLVVRDENDPIGFGPIWSVYIKDDDIQVERPYTPLESIDENGNMVFWIKRYPKGEVGRWLHSKQVGDTIELRGPLKTWPWNEDKWNEVVLISGGTGITPFYQLLRQVFEHPTIASQNIRFTLLHGSRTPEEMPPEQILGPLASYAENYPDRFRLKLLVDTNDGSKPTASLPLEVGRVSEEHVRRILNLPEPTHWQTWFGRKDTRPPIPSKTLFLVCGPEQMVAAVSGPYGRNYSQGPTLGVLGKLGVTPKQVWKL